MGAVIRYTGVGLSVVLVVMALQLHFMAIEMHRDARAAAGWKPSWYVEFVHKNLKWAYLFDDDDEELDRLIRQELQRK